MLDLIFTLIWLHLGLATEANPLLGHYLFHYGTATFIGVKLVLGWGGTYILYARRDCRGVCVITKCLCAVYGIVLLLHIPGLPALWERLI